MAPIKQRNRRLPPRYFPKFPLRSRPPRPKNAKYVSTAATTGDTFPHVKLEIAYGSGPTTDLTTATWTDETQYFRSGSTLRGKSNASDEVTTGTAAGVLRNETRHFDPDFNANIVPLLPVRYTATFNSTPYPLYTGYMTGTPQSYPSPLYSEVSFRCVDAFEILKEARQLGTAWESQAAIVAPDHWYRLSDTGTTAADAIGGATGTYQGSVLDSQDSLVATDSDKCINLRGGAVGGSGFVTLPTSASPSSGTWAVAGWFKTNGTVTGNWPLVSFIDPTNPTANYITVWISNGGTGSAGTIVAQCHQLPLSGGVASNGTVRVDDSTAHHFLAVYTNASLKVYVDGVLDASGASSTNVSIGGAGYIGSGGGGPLGGAKADLSIDEVMVWRTGSPTAQNAADLYNAGAHGWRGDTTGQRINRYLDSAQWPAAMRDIDQGVTTMAAAGSVSDPLTGMTNAVKAEGGLLYVSPMGKVVFRDRRRRRTDGNSTAPIATFGDGTGSEYPYSNKNFDPQFDRDRIVTQVTGSRVGLSQVTVTDAGSRYGFRTMNLGQLELDNDGELEARLEYTLNQYKDPQYRLDSLRLQPGYLPGSTYTWASAMFWSIVLSLELSQRFNVKRRPQNVGSATTFDVLVEQIGHSFAPMEWEAQAALSPADTRTYARFNVSKFDGSDGFAY